jgi:hypothetical protein
MTFRSRNPSADFRDSPKALEDGLVMWEDEFLYRGESVSWSGAWLANHILYGRDHRPYLTHFVATVQKRPGTSRRRSFRGQSAST